MPDLGLEMAYIRTGTFTMGSPDSEQGRYVDEGPQMQVTLTKGYWLGKTEVTGRLSGRHVIYDRDGKIIYETTFPP